MHKDYGVSSQILPTDNRQVKWLEQRQTRGWDDTELWNLDCTVAQFILPRLKVFVERNTSFQCEDMEKIVEMFEFLTSQDVFLPTENQTKLFEEGMILFARYYRSLWC